MRKLIIESKPTKKGQKTRKFSATLMGYIEVPLEAVGANDKETRPVYVVVVGTTASLRPFVANFYSMGKRADVTGSSYHEGSKMRCLKTAGFLCNTQTYEGEYATATIYLPLAFTLDPGMIDPVRCEFLSMPPKWWVKEQSELITDDMREKVLTHAQRLGLLSENESVIGVPACYTEDAIVEIIPHAAHFMMLLDKRTKKPLPNGIDFAIQLYFAAMAEGIASTAVSPSDRYRVRSGRGIWHQHSVGIGFNAWNADAIGFVDGVFANATHVKLDGFLKSQVKIYNGVLV